MPRPSDLGEVVPGEAAVQSRLRIASSLGHLPSGVRQSEFNVLVITLDTTRADRLGAYGYAGIQTPNLDRSRSEGVLFEQAASAAPLTLPGAFVALHRTIPARSTACATTAATSSTDGRQTLAET